MKTAVILIGKSMLLLESRRND